MYNQHRTGVEHFYTNSRQNILSEAAAEQAEDGCNRSHSKNSEYPERMPTWGTETSRDTARTGRPGLCVAPGEVSSKEQGAGAGVSGGGELPNAAALTARCQHAPLAPNKHFGNQELLMARPFSWLQWVLGSILLPSVNSVKNSICYQIKIQQRTNSVRLFFPSNHFISISIVFHFSPPSILILLHSLCYHFIVM